VDNFCNANLDGVSDLVDWLRFKSRACVIGVDGEEIDFTRQSLS